MPLHTELGRRSTARDAETLQVMLYENPVTVGSVDVSVLAGNGLTGGGKLTSDVTLNVGAGTGIGVSSDTVYVDVNTGFTWLANHTFSAGLSIAAGQSIGFGADVILSRLSADLLGLGVGDTLAVDTITDRASGNLTIAPAGDIVLNPTGNDILPLLNYDLNLGSIFKKYLTIHAAELWVETLVAQDTMATIGGRVLVGPTTTLTNDVTPSQTWIYVKHDQMAVGDRVRLESGGKVEWMAITAGPTTDVGRYLYDVTRNLDGTGANEWYAGDAVFNTGVTGEGFIDLYSLTSVKGGSQAGPTIVGWMRNSATFNDITEAWAIGNLNGLYGVGGNYMGVGIGNVTTGNYLLYDTSGGFRLRAGDNAVVLDTNGIGISLPTTQSYNIISKNSFRIFDAANSNTVVASLAGYRDSYNSGAIRIQLSATNKPLDIYAGGGITIFPVTTAIDDIRVGGGLYVGATNVDPATGQLMVSSQILINTTTDYANPLTINTSKGLLIFGGGSGSYTHSPGLMYNMYYASGAWNRPNTNHSRAMMLIEETAGDIVFFASDNTASTVPSERLRIGGAGAVAIAGALDHNGSTVGFYGATPVTRAGAISSLAYPLTEPQFQVSALNQDRAAINAILTALRNLGLITT